MAIAAKQKSFQKYKPTGIDWVGGVPSGWRVEYMKNLGRFESSGIDKKIVEGEPLVQMVNYTDIYGNESRTIDGERELMTVSCPAWKVAEANLIRGDLVFTPSSETIEDIGLSALILDDLKNTVFSYHVIRFRFSEKLDHGFKKYLCNNNLVLQQFSSVAKGTTRQILDRNDFKNIIVVIPPIELQKQIADFLDLKTAKIDEVVGKKQKLIELLKEKRQALITRAVTKGLDPKAKMKPSGVDWLGDIPEGWKVKKLKYVAKSNVSSLAEDTTPDYLLKYLDIGNVGTGYILEEPMEMYFENAPSRARRIVKKNDTIISTVRTYLKAIYHFEDDSKDLIVSTGFAVIEAGKEINPKFFYYLSLSENFIDSIVSNSYGVSYPAINESFLMTLPAWYPKIETQKEIVVFLDRETVKINGIIKKVEIQIEKLQEYRQALISNAVTGKIKV